MTSLVNNKKDDFVQDDFESDTPITNESQDDFVEDDFEPEEPEKNKTKDLGWLEKKFSPEGQRLEAKENRNFAKGITSGVFAGFSEMVPGLEVEDTVAKGQTGKLIGSFLPLGLGAKAIAYPLKAAASLSPKFVKPLQSLGNLLGLSAAGGLYEGLEESAEKSIEKGEFVPPSPETILEQGGKWAALDITLRSLGWTGRFARALYDKSYNLGIPAMDLLENVTRYAGSGDKAVEKALSVLEDKPVQAIEKEITLSKAKIPEKTELLAKENFDTRVQQRSQDLRSRKIDQKDFTKLEEGAASAPEPYLPKEFESEVLAEQVLENDLSQRIDNVSQRAVSEKAFGQNIQQDIERSIATHQKETDALYDIAKDVESTKTPSVKKTANSIVQQLQKIESGGLNLTPEGYNKAKKQLLDVLADLGYGVETGKDGLIVRAIENTRQPLSKLVEIKKRLNKIINYDLLDTSAQDFLKGPVNELRGEIRQGYGAKNSKARKAFEQAEKQFGEFAEKKGKKSIRATRASEKPESLAKTIRTPSGLADIKEVVSKEQFAQVERELLEFMNTQDQQRVASLYRELRPSLTENTRAIVEEMIESKAPASSPTRKIAQRNAIQKKALDDIAQATLTGQRPKAALDLWKTKEGQQLIKQSLENNPNKEEVLKYLQDQSFKDFSSSVIMPDGKIDFKKLDSFLKDQATAENIKLVAGEDGLTFFKQLETLSNRIKKNASVMENVIGKGTASDRNKIEKEIEKLGKNRLEAIKNKKNELTKEEKVFQDKFNKDAIKERKEAEQSRENLGKERFKKSKQKTETQRKEQVAADEAKTKSNIIYKLDDLISSYGLKGKGLLAAVGIWKIGTVEGLSLAASYEIFSRLAKNKSVQSAIKRAAAPNSSPVSLIQSLISIEKEMDK